MKIIISLILVFLCLEWTRGTTQAKERQKIFIPPSKKMKTYAFGQEQAIASLMWVRVLQDIEVCDQNSERSLMPALSENKDPLEDVLSRKLPEARCQHGWVFQMLDVITDLAPKFHGAYSHGATFLSVLVDDRKGAQKIFDKGVEAYPENWNLLYRAGYHELFEMQNPGKAAEYLRRAAENGAPNWVYSLSAKLYSKTGQAAFAKSILESVLERNPDGMHAERLRQQLKKINKYLGVPE